MSTEKIKKDKDLDITNKTKKTVQIEFEQPVSCGLSDLGSEFLEKCFHRQYPPRFSQCHRCLIQNFHRFYLLSKWGTPMKELEMRDGSSKEIERKFGKFTTNGQIEYK